MEQFSGFMHIKEVQLIHFTHCDYGYTDHPIINIHQHVDFLRQAIRFASETAGYPDEAKFRWTVEGLWTLENFWKIASASEKGVFDRLYADGQIEVTGFPGNMTMLSGRQEWCRELKRLDYFFKTYKPKVVLQNDINGLPWGMLPDMLDRGFEFLWMGLNEYGSKAPTPVPSIWWWQGPDTRKLLTHMAFKYTDGYDFFHSSWWRRGPVPEASNVWFHPPANGQIFSTSSTSLTHAQQCTYPMLQRVKPENYPFSKLAVSVTNMWRCDNDPPFKGLSDFVQAWNEAGHFPKLRLTTPGRFLDEIKESTGSLPVRHGDWSDWWADGLSSMPAAIGNLMDAKRITRQIEPLADKLKVSLQATLPILEELNHKLVFAQEHTFDAYDSAAKPYGILSQGNQNHRLNVINESLALAQYLQSSMIRQSERYADFSTTRFFEVISPFGNGGRGYVTIPDDAFRDEANAARNTNTGEIYPFEKVYGYEWSEPTMQSEKPLEFPSDVWDSRVMQRRFYLSAKETDLPLRFELLQNDDILREGPILLEWDRAESSKPSGRILIPDSGLPLFDDTSPWFPGQLIVERPEGPFGRTQAEYRKKDELVMNYSTPRLLKVEDADTHYGQIRTLRLEADFAKAIVQEIAIHKGETAIDFTTTIWLKETLEPMALFMAFPVAVNFGEAQYLSFGHPTRVYHDQMADSCGEHTVAPEGIWWEGKDANLVLYAPDNPLMVFEKPASRSLRPVFKPSCNHVHSLLFSNYWVTNFPLLKPAKLVFRHSLIYTNQCAKDDLESYGNWVAFPAK